MSLEAGAWRGEGWEVRNDEVRAFLDSYDGERFDAVITDPPYSSGGATRGDRTVRTALKYVNNDSGNRSLPDFEGDGRDQRGFVAWSSLWMSEAWRRTKPGGALVVFSDWRQLPATTDAVQAGGWIWRGLIAWNKINGRPQTGRFRAQCEYAVFATKGPHRAYDGAPCLDGCYSISPPTGRVHITEKPVELARQLVRVAPPGGLIFDPFTGSGALAEGFLRERRRVLALELVPEFAAYTAERLEAATLQGELEIPIEPTSAPVQRGLDLEATEAPCPD